MWREATTMIQAGSRNRRSLLILRENEGALDNCLHIYGEALGAPFVHRRRRGNERQDVPPGPLSAATRPHLITPS